MSEQQARFLEFGPFRMDRVRRRLLNEGRMVPLTSKAFDTLLALVESGGEVVEKEDLMRKVWPDSFVEEGNLTQNISVLRKTLGESPGAHRYIVTVPRVGYRFVAVVKRLSPDTPTTTNATTEVSARPPELSLAVLPFKPLAHAGVDDEYIGLGMADALITRLSNIRRLVVRPTSAVLKYASVEQDPSAAGRELQVALVLEGSIRKSGGRLRATVQLVSVGDGRSLWAERFDEQFTDIFKVEDSVAERVARALSLRLTGEERERIKRRYTGDAAAHEFYLKGRYYSNKFTLESFRKAVESFDRALELDPEYALAYAGLAESYWIAADLYLNPREALRKAQEAAARAVAADEGLAEAHTFLAATKMNYDWDWAEAERHFERALELNPSHAPARHWYGWYLTLKGRHDEALSQLHYAKRLDPLSLGINWFLSASLCLAGRYDESIEAARELIDLEPNFWAGHWALAIAHAYKGEYREAFAAYSKAEALDASPMIRAAHAHALARAGERGAAQTTLAELKSHERDAYVPPYYLALIHLALDEPEHALDYLETAYRERDGNLPLLKVDRRLDPLRPDPRLQELIRRLNLAD